MATSRAFGGSDADILPVAVAIELLHNAFLVHDDIVDGSERRRGRPTLTAEYGLGLALNAGDALAVLSNQVLRRHAACMEAELAERVLSEFDAMALRTLEGQATELGWRRDRVEDLAPEDYLDLIMHKTCWYTTVHPLRVGSAGRLRAGTPTCGRWCGSGSTSARRSRSRTICLNLLGTEREYGKEIDGDLYEGKRTLPLIHLLRNAHGRDREMLDRYLGLERPERTPAMVAEVRGLLDAYGSIDSRRSTPAASPEPRSMPSRRRFRAAASRPRPGLRAGARAVHARSHLVATPLAGYGIDASLRREQRVAGGRVRVAVRAAVVDLGAAQLPDRTSCLLTVPGASASALVGDRADRAVLR